MPRVIHFEIYADDISRAIKFYADAFNWNFTPFGNTGYWSIKTGMDNDPGINGGLMKRRGEIDGQAVIGYVCTIGVDDYNIYKDKIINSGGENILEKMLVPGLGWLGYFKDTEGNIFGIFQDDTEAIQEYI